MPPKIDATPLQKVNEKGEYTFFPGITVVSACYPKHKDFCDNIYHALASSKLITQYFSLLPAQSYHMTTMDLHTQERIELLQKDWSEFVTDSLPDFRYKKEKIDEEAISPLIESIQLHTKKGLLLTLTLPKAQVMQIQRLAASLGVKSSVPSVFHITLAYPRPIAQRSPEINAELDKEIFTQLKKLISLEQAMVLSPAQICYFFSMEQFIPWDTKKSPFNIVKSQLIHKSSSDEHFKLAKDDASTTSMNTDKPLSVRCLTFFCGGNSSDSEDEQKQLKP